MIYSGKQTGPLVTYYLFFSTKLTYTINYQTLVFTINRVRFTAAIFTRVLCLVTSVDFRMSRLSAPAQSTRSFIRAFFYVIFKFHQLKNTFYSKLKAHTTVIFVVSPDFSMRLIVLLHRERVDSRQSEAEVSPNTWLNF